MATLSEPGRAALRRPAPEILHPRPLLDQAAEISAAYGGTGLLIAEMLIAEMLIAEMLTTSLHHGRTLWYGSDGTSGDEPATSHGISESPSTSSRSGDSPLGLNRPFWVVRHIVPTNLKPGVARDDVVPSPPRSNVRPIAAPSHQRLRPRLRRSVVVTS
jgi:hypothetical protein